MRRLLILVLVMAAVHPASAGEPKVRRDMLVTTGWLATHLGQKPGRLGSFFGKKEVVVLQVGWNRKAYDAGHVPGAQFVGIDELAVTQNGVPMELPDDAALLKLVRRLGLDRHKLIILYDDQDGLAAARAWFTLDFLRLGDRAALLDGGWTKWKAEGRAVSTALPPAPRATSYRPRMPHDERVTLPEVRAISHEILAGENAHVVLIDARPEKNFSGAEAGKGVPRAGHIPGAKNVYWKKALLSDGKPVLRPVSDLRGLFAAAGVGKKTTAVTYCQSGVQASYDYFLLRYLGYDPRLYDGSFIEWSAARETAVEKGK